MLSSGSFTDHLRFLPYIHYISLWFGLHQLTRSTLASKQMTILVVMLSYLHIMTTTNYSPFSSSWLRGRSGTSWPRSNSHRKAGWALALALIPRASQRWAALHRDWLRTTSHAGSEGPHTLLTYRGHHPTPPPPRLTDRHRHMHGRTDGYRRATHGPSDRQGEI